MKTGETPSEQGPPLFRTWRRAYVTVLVFLAILIICFALLSRMVS